MSVVSIWWNFSVDRTILFGVVWLLAQTALSVERGQEIQAVSKRYWTGHLVQLDVLLDLVFPTKEGLFGNVMISGSVGCSNRMKLWHSRSWGERERQMAFQGPRGLTLGNPGIGEVRFCGTQLWKTKELKRAGSSLRASSSKHKNTLSQQSGK